MSQHHKRDLELAIKSVLAAKSRLGNGSIKDRSVEIDDGREWKVAADRECESAILEVLQKGSDYAILSEESGTFSGKGTHQWIVDPLDGSANFSRNLPFYCVSVGLWENESPVLGAVLELPSNRLFTGVVGTGAWCNDQPIEPRRGGAIRVMETVLCTGLPARFDHSRANVENLVKACGCFGKVRMFGSAALMLCYVASGRCDSYWESQIALWDIGAAVAIVQAAGGVTRIGKINKELRVDVEAASCETLLVSEVVGR